MDIKSFLDESCKAIVSSSVNEVDINFIKQAIDNQNAWLTLKEYFSNEKFLMIDNPEAVEILNKKFEEAGYFEDININNDEEVLIKSIKVFFDKNVGYTMQINNVDGKKIRTIYIWNA